MYHQMTMERPPDKHERKAAPHKEVFDLFGPLRTILDSLRNDIEAGNYAVVIGDDASGRIPTLAVERFLRARYGALGYPPPKTRFVAGSGSGSESISGADAERKSAALNEFVGGLNVPEGKRALIVTDVVLTGGSLSPLVAALEAHGIAFDIATIGFDEKLGELALGWFEASGGRIISGGPDLYPNIFKRHDLAGVVKEKTELHARRYRDSEEIMGWHKWFARRRAQRTINEVRDDVADLADALEAAYEVPKHDVGSPE